MNARHKNEIVEAKPQTIPSTRINWSHLLCAFPICVLFNVDPFYSKNKNMKKKHLIFRFSV